jgi:hypothetical protein
MNRFVGAKEEILANEFSHGSWAQVEYVVGSFEEVLELRD